MEVSTARARRVPIHLATRVAQTCHARSPPPDRAAIEEQESYEARGHRPPRTYYNSRVHDLNTDPNDLARPNHRAPAADDAMARRAVVLARWLDERWLDPLIGLVLPEAGDLVTAGAGLYIIAAAIQKGLPAVVIARMLLNLAVDLAIGAVPALGDLLDFAYKANSRNARLLEQSSPGKSTPRDWLIVIGAALLFLAVLAIPIVTLVWLILKLFG